MRFREIARLPRIKKPRMKLTKMKSIDKIADLSKGKTFDELAEDQGNEEDSSD